MFRLSFMVGVSSPVAAVKSWVRTRQRLMASAGDTGAVDEAFQLPAWAGREVTEHARYYNLALAAHPFARWTDLEKR